MSNSGGWIAVDLDGTLAEYDGWHGPDHIGKPIPRMVARVKQWLAEGKDVRIFTARASVDPVVKPREHIATIRVIEDWCMEHLGAVLPVTCKKDFTMMELWDDRCVQVIPNSGMTVKEYAGIKDEVNIIPIFLNERRK
jgi:hypothetical protein